MNKLLERDREKAVLGGVIAGLANYFQQDPVLFRIVAIFLMLLSGFFPVIIGYLIAWIIMPVRDKREVDFEEIK